VASSGTARSIAARLPGLLPLAGKTGTTNDLRDSWFAGFGDDVLGVMWLGRDDNQPSQLTGSSGALQVWIDIMQVLKPRALSFISPEGIEWAKTYHGKRVTNDCFGAVDYPFIEGYLPEISETCQNEPLLINTHRNERTQSVKTERKNETKDNKSEDTIRRHFDLR
jgi:penicillin-binding protein 1B